MKYKYLLLPLAAVSATAGIAAAHLLGSAPFSSVSSLYYDKTKQPAPVVVCLVSFVFISFFIRFVTLRM